MTQSTFEILNQCFSLVFNIFSGQQPALQYDRGCVLTRILNRHDGYLLLLKQNLHMYNTSCTKESRCYQLSFNVTQLHKAIGRSNKETTVNFIILKSGPFLINDITGCMSRVKQRMQLFALLEHLCPQQVFRGVGVTKSFVSCLVICRSVFVFFFDQCIDRPFSMSGFWLPLCCLQTFRESTFY